MNSKKCAFPYIVWSFVFTVVPLLLVFFYAIKSEDGSFTFLNILSSFKYIGVFIKSFYVGIVSTVICLFVAYPLAYGVSRCSPRWQNILNLLFMLPMWINILLRTYAWLTILENNGIMNQVLTFFHLPKINIINTDAAIILGMVYNFLPYTILPLHASISKIDKKIIEAARDLGASKRQVFFKIILPLSVPGVISGVTIVFVPSVSTFVVSNILGGGKSLLIGDLIEMQFLGSSYDPFFGCALSVVLMFFVFVFVFLINRLDTSNTRENIGESKNR